MSDKIIGPGNAFLLKALAIAVDVLQAILLAVGVGVVVDTIVTVVATLVFVIYFVAIDRRIITNQGNIYLALTGVVGEAIPVINIMPLWYRTIKKIIENSNTSILTPKKPSEAGGGSEEGSV